MRRSYIILAVYCAFAFSGTATQTDWSGGDGVSGPVVDWGTSFDTSTNILAVDSLLSLAPVILPTPIEYIVDSSYLSAALVYACDIDGDGDIDVLGSSQFNDNISWWENTDGTGTVWVEHLIDNSFNNCFSLQAADVDGDGDLDILSAGAGLAWWENTAGTGTAWVKRLVNGSSSVAGTALHACDMDGDGDIDVIGTTLSADSELSWWENIDGAGTAWTEHLIDFYIEGVVSVNAGDVDDDGDIDVLVAAYSDVFLWENTDGAGTAWTEHSVDNSFNGVTCIYVSDVDSDGDIDILGAAEGCDDIVWWENADGAGTAWIEHIVDSFFDYASSVYGCDVDNDGDIDILGAAQTADEIAWWENTDGIGTTWIEHTVENNLNGARSVYAADIDGDGDFDILGAGQQADDLIWWDVHGYTYGVLESSVLNVEDLSSWDLFTASFEEPSNTTVGFQFRSSTDSANMGAWSDTVYTTTPLSGILDDGTQYLQYRVLLNTTDPCHSPVLQNVWFSYSSFVELEESTTEGITNWGISSEENPCDGDYSALITVPEAGMVQFSIYDVFGRTILESLQEFPVGSHSVGFHGLTSGMYFCVMNGGDYTAIERVVVVK